MNATVGDECAPPAWAIVAITSLLSFSIKTSEHADCEFSTPGNQCTYNILQHKLHR